MKILSSACLGYFSNSIRVGDYVVFGNAVSVNPTVRSREERARNKGNAPSSAYKRLPEKRSLPTDWSRGTDRILLLRDVT